MNIWLMIFNLLRFAYVRSNSGDDCFLGNVLSVKSLFNVQFEAGDTFGGVHSDPGLLATLVDYNVYL